MDLLVFVYIAYMGLAAFVAFVVTTGVLGMGGGWGFGAWAGGGAVAVPVGLLGLVWSFSAKHHGQSFYDLLLVALLSGLCAAVLAEARYVFAARRGQMPALLARRRLGVTCAILVLAALAVVWWSHWLVPKLANM